MQKQKPVVVVVLVQKNGLEFKYQGEREIEQEVKLRIGESSITNSFDVSHVKYLPGDFEGRGIASESGIGSRRGRALGSGILPIGARR